MRPIVVVPEAMPVPKALHLMQQRHVQMVLVADEYGGTAGLITMEDLVEEIVGDIQDEHEAQEPPDVLQLPNGSIEFDGMVLLDDVAEQLPIAFDDPEEDTIGGYVFGLLGRKPEIDLMPTPEQRDNLRKHVAEFRASKPLVVIDFWNDGPMVSGCMAGGRKYIHINANGDVEPCVFCHFAVDNIRKTTLREALGSPLFRKIRQKQEHDNLLRPCMLIDHPDNGRELFESEGAYPTHPGAEEIFTTLADKMDDYSAEYAKIADKVWDEEFKEHPSRKKRGSDN